jgi:transposase
MKMGTAGKSDMEVRLVEQPTRRHRSKQERRQIVEESWQPGASVAVVARRHGVNANQVFHWRKLLREGRLDGKQAPGPLMPVHIAEDCSGASRQHTGAIQIDFGRVQVRVEGAADPATLRIILEQLSR